MDVTEKVQESEKPQPVEPEPAAAIEMAAPQIAVEREELPLPEEVKDEAISPEEWQAEAETVEVIAAVEEEGENAAKFTDEELEAQALAAQAAEEAVMVVRRRKKTSRWKRSFRSRKNRLKKVSLPA